MSNNISKTQNKDLGKKQTPKKIFFIFLIPFVLVLIIITIFTFTFLNNEEKNSKVEDVNLSSSEFENLEKKDKIKNLVLDIEDAIESLDESTKFDRDLINDQSLGIIPSENEEQVEE